MDRTAQRPPGPNFDLFARYYDLEFASFTDDVMLYVQFAARAGGRVLELGCGTGRLLLPLCERGLAVTGVDLSGDMLALARGKTRSLPLKERARLVQDDIRTLDELGAEVFDLAISAINSFMHLETLPDQRSALRAVARHLRPGGLLIADLFPPEPGLLAAYDGRLVHAATLQDAETGDRIDKFSASSVNHAEQRIETTYFYDRMQPNGAVERTAAPFALRYVGRFEIELLLYEAGFREVLVYGSYDLEPFGPESDRMIVTATR